MASYNSQVDDWIDDGKLILLRNWRQEGYSLKDISNKIGVDPKTLYDWRKEYPEIEAALKEGKEIIDYKVQDALLKTALGYKTKESKVTFELLPDPQSGEAKMVKTKMEVIEKEVPPNVASIQYWLNNRNPDKWKRNRDNIIDINEEDQTIQISVIRAGSKQDESDDKWNEEIKIEKTKENKKEKKTHKSDEINRNNEQNESKGNSLKEDDVDYWPDDWSE